MRGLGVLRALVVGGAGCALVLGAQQLPGSVDLAAGRAAQPSPQPSRATEAVSRSALVCPGPELLGVSGAKFGTQQVEVLVAAPPAASLPRAVPGAGTVTPEGLPAGGSWRTLTSRGSTSAAPVHTARSVLFNARGGLAPGTAAMQYSLRQAGDTRALTTTTCGRAGADHWLVAGGAQPGRLERVVLTNPGPNAVTASIELLGAKGLIDSPNGRGVVVAPHSRTVVLLDAIAGAEQSPVAHVTVQGGILFAAVNDSWLDGVVARGADTTTTTAPPAREQVVAGVAIDGAASLRVAVPGNTEAVVETRVLTVDGPRRIKDDVVRVPAHSTRDIDLSALPSGAYGVQVRADVPVVAAALVERGVGDAAAARLDRRPSDLAWAPAVRPVGDLAGTPLPTGSADLANTLMLTAVGAGTAVSVDLVGRPGPGAVRTVSVDVPADSTTTVDLQQSSAVWVRPGPGTVHAAVVSTAAGAPGKDAGTLVAVMPLTGAALTMSPVPLRQVDDQQAGG